MAQIASSQPFRPSPISAPSSLISSTRTLPSALKKTPTSTNPSKKSVSFIDGTRPGEEAPTVQGKRRTSATWRREVEQRRQSAQRATEPSGATSTPSNGSDERYIHMMQSLRLSPRETQSIKWSRVRKEKEAKTVSGRQIETRGLAPIGQQEQVILQDGKMKDPLEKLEPPSKKGKRWKKQQKTTGAVEVSSAVMGSDGESYIWASDESGTDNHLPEQWVMVKRKRRST